jgi:predicted outer membrane protein
VRPPVPRFVRWTVALAVVAALTLAVFQYWGTSQYPVAIAPRGQTAIQDANTMPTQWGPLRPADRDLLVMIRQAGLCGGSSGQQVQKRGSNPQVRTVAKRISLDYDNLDNQVRAVAGKLGVSLPNQPTVAQQSWLKELSGQSGAKYDRMFAQHLRVTDGEVLPAITAVRASTQNELIRSFAANAATLVSRHMDTLERTGLVDYSKLPTPPAAIAPARPAQPVDQVVNVAPVRAATTNDTKAVIAGLLAVAGALAVLGLLGSTSRRVRRPAGAQHRSAPGGYYDRPAPRRHAAHRW